MQTGHHHLRHHQQRAGRYRLLWAAHHGIGAGSREALTQTDLADPNNPGNTLAECLPFADGYTWGPLMALDVSIGGERAPGLTVNIIE